MGSLQPGLTYYYGVSITEREREGKKEDYTLRGRENEPIRPGQKKSKQLIERARAIYT